MPRERGTCTLISEPRESRTLVFLSVRTPSYVLSTRGRSVLVEVNRARNPSNGDSKFRDLKIEW